MRNGLDNSSAMVRKPWAAKRFTVTNMDATEKDANETEKTECNFMAQTPQSQLLLHFQSLLYHMEFHFETRFTSGASGMAWEFPA